MVPTHQLVTISKYQRSAACTARGNKIIHIEYPALVILWGLWITMQVRVIQVCQFCCLLIQGSE
jgi:hypothetical protein